uniref:Uncharacterized protein n=1 Tax=Anguilla anguilla TaxID=7936 RepID=A0A0E9W827_ANGAN
MHHNPYVSSPPESLSVDRLFLIFTCCFCTAFPVCGWNRQLCL